MKHFLKRMVDRGREDIKLLVILAILHVDFIELIENLEHFPFNQIFRKWGQMAQTLPGIVFTETGNF